ncbi:unnamed protein product [Symbiodinium natans]|uniref:Uncharacterized protein n=1 Tax=Symbiodinium natans TaxID=878477 RepID=A0A812J8E1_9DINO|nr:unnamed protein product [Symbiodinium natans]
MAAAGDWRAPLRHVREVLRTAPLCTLEAAQAELKAILAEVAARCGKNLDEAEMEAAIMHDLELKGYHLEPALPELDDSALLAQEMQICKRRRLTGKTKALPSPKGSEDPEKVPQSEDGFVAMSDQEALCSPGEVAQSSPTRTEELRDGDEDRDGLEALRFLREPTSASSPDNAARPSSNGLDHAVEEEEGEEEETVFVSRKAFTALRALRRKGLQHISSGCIYRLFDATLQDGEALVALDASQLVTPWRSSRAGVEAAPA